MSAYLLESSLCLLIMLLLYRLVLAKTTLHKLKRFYLLSCILFPLILPVVTIDVFYNSTLINQIEDNSSRWLSTTAFNGTETESSTPSESLNRPITPVEGQATNARSFDRAVVPFLGYGLITVLFLVLLIRNLWRIRRLIDRSKHKYFEHYQLILLKDRASPYSFFRFIFMSNDDYEVPAVRAQLLSHELIHVRQWHSLDIMLIELSKVVFWFNPLYWWLAKNIRLNHEYLADAGVMSKRENGLSYQHLLLQFYQRPKVVSPLVCPSDYSFIKNRFQMMQKSTTRKAALIRLLLLVPILGGVLFSFAMDLKPRSVTPQSLEIEKSKTTEPGAPTGFPVEGVKFFGETYQKPANLPAWNSTDAYPGLDMTSAADRGVIATGDGIVEKAVANDSKYGNYVLIRHNETFKTLYASLNRLEVKEGETVKLGQALGGTGRSMEKLELPQIVDRVHYAVWKSGKWVDPRDYYPKLPVLELDYSSTVYAKSEVQHNVPDVLPFDATRGQFMAFSGSIKGRTPKITSKYDTTWGTEFFSLPATLIKVTAAGTVTEVGQSHELYGNYLKVRHDDEYETMYAKLDQITVKEGQVLPKGGIIGQIGKPSDMFGRLHYKVFKNGTPGMLDPDLIRKASVSLGHVQFRRMKEARKEWNMDSDYVPWSFPKDFAFADIFYDREKAVFVKQNGEVIIKMASELNRSHKTALLQFRSRPHSTGERKQPVPEEVYSRWEKPWVYKIYLDGKHVESREMANYKPEDFVHCSWVVVSKELKEKNGAAFELYLMTEKYYDQYLKNKRNKNSEWRKQTQALLALFKDF